MNEKIELDNGNTKIKKKAGWGMSKNSFNFINVIRKELINGEIQKDSI